MTLKIAEFHEAGGTEDWRVVGDGACAFYPTASFAASLELVSRLAQLEIGDHAPDVDVRHDGVTLRLVTATAESYGMSQRDVEVARACSAVARELGLTAEPSAVQSVLVIVESLAPSGVMPFWRAVLGYEPRADSPDEDLVDPRGRGPGLWFEELGEARSGRGAIHVAAWMPEDQTESRVAAALAAGGRMVRDDFAPAWWTLADAAGNEADVASTATRD